MATAQEHTPLHIRTPLMYSSVLSERVGAHVYLKLENTQPSGSFKHRGIGHLVQRSISPRGPAHTHLVCPSGGNAGLACAHAAAALGTKCSVYVPAAASDRVVAKLRGLGAEVIRGGAHWAEADAAAKERLEGLEGGMYASPSDHALLVEGNASLMVEVDEQLREQKASPLAALVCSVGGGGMVAGALKGMAQTDGRVHCPVVACETTGAASFAAAFRASYAAGGKPTPVKLPGIKTIATSLGVSSVSDEALERCLAHDQAEHGGVVSLVMEDGRALDAVRKFTDDHAFFVEPACSVSLAPLYEPGILRAALPQVAFAPAGQKPPPDAPSLVVIVCGGTTISLDLFAKWEKEFAERGEGLGKVTLLRRGVEEVIEA